MTSAGRSFAANAAKEPRACAPRSSVRGSWQKRRSISPPPARRLQGGPLASDGPVPVATRPRRPDGKRAAVGETAQAPETEACSGRQMVQAVAERYRADPGSASVGAGERLGVVVVSVDEQKLEACPPEQGATGAEEATPFRVARQVAEVAE